VIADVRELVREDAADLVQRQVHQQPFGHRDRSVLGVAAGRERVGLLARHHIQPRYRDSRTRHELSYRCMHFGCVGLGKRAGVGDAKRDSVGVEVADRVHDHRESDE
jgi:hypothetical protein